MAVLISSAPTTGGLVDIRPGVAARAVDAARRLPGVLVGAVKRTLRCRVALPARGYASESGISATNERLSLDAPAAGSRALPAR